MFPLSINLLLALPIALPQGGGGWDTLHELQDSRYDLFGDQVVASPDFDGDGLDDIVVATSRGDFGNVVDAGAVLTYSGATGVQIGLIDGPYRSAGLGIAVAAMGDVDGDGLSDIAVGANAYYEGGTVQVFRSSDWTALYTLEGNSFPYSMYRFGGALDSIGDINGDGIHELLLLDPKAGLPQAFVVSGADGSLLRSHHRAGPFTKYGQSSSSFQDIDGDGVDDYLIGAPDEPLTTGVIGAVHAYSGADGSLLMTIPCPANMIGLGESVTFIDDFNGDGIADILAGAPQSRVPGHGTAGAVSIHSGLDGSQIHALLGNRANSGFGSSVAAIGDIDWDGIPDFAVGAPTWSYNGSIEGGTVLTYSGATGRRVDRIKTGDDYAQIGRVIDAMDDLNGDGTGELLLASSEQQRVYVGTPSPYMFADRNEISSAQGGSIRFDLDFPDRTNGFEYRLVVSTSGPGWHEHQIWIPLVYDTAYELSWNNQYWPAKTYHAHGFLDRYGNATAGFEVMPGDLNFLVGHQLRFAAVCMRPGKDPKFTSAALVVDVLP